MAPKLEYLDEAVIDAESAAQWYAERSPTAERLVFSTRTGQPISPNNVLRRAIFPACDSLKLPRAT